MAATSRERADLATALARSAVCSRSVGGGGPSAESGGERSRLLLPTTVVLTKPHVLPSTD